MPAQVGRRVPAQPAEPTPEGRSTTSPPEFRPRAPAAPGRGRPDRRRSPNPSAPRSSQPPAIGAAPGGCQTSGRRKTPAGGGGVSDHAGPACPLQQGREAGRRQSLRHDRRRRDRPARRPAASRRATSAGVARISGNRPAALPRALTIARSRAPSSRARVADLRSISVASASASWRSPSASTPATVPQRSGRIRRLIATTISRLRAVRRRDSATGASRSTAASCSTSRARAACHLISNASWSKAWRRAAGSAVSPAGAAGRTIDGGTGPRRLDQGADSLGRIDLGRLAPAHQPPQSRCRRGRPAAQSRLPTRDRIGADAQPVLRAKRAVSKPGSTARFQPDAPTLGVAQKATCAALRRIAAAVVSAAARRCSASSDRGRRWQRRRIPRRVALGPGRAESMPNCAAPARSSRITCPAAGPRTAARCRSTASSRTASGAT